MNCILYIFQWCQKYTDVNEYNNYKYLIYDFPITFSTPRYICIAQTIANFNLGQIQQQLWSTVSGEIAYTRNAGFQVTITGSSERSAASMIAIGN